MSLGANSLLMTLMVAGQSLPLPAHQNPCLNRTLAVNVLTDQGQLVKELTAANFRAKYRGQPVHIVSASYDRGPRRILILLDASGSMVEDSGKWKSGLAVAESLVSSSPAQDSFALLVFSLQVETRIDFNQGRQAVAEGLTKLEQQRLNDHKGPRRTALFDAIASGLALFGPPRDGDAIYVISDGEDNASRTKPPTARSALFASGMRLFAFDPIDFFPLARAADEASSLERFTRLVKESGGDYFGMTPGEGVVGYRPFATQYMPSEADRAAISWASHSLGREIDEFYRLAGKLPEVVDKPRDWQLDVIEPATGKKAGHVRVIYPRMLAPCP